MNTIINAKKLRRCGAIFAKLAASALLVCNTLTEAAPSRSTNIALYQNGTRLINVNEDSGSVTVFAVNPTGSATTALKKLQEIKVGFEPHCVAVKADNTRAYVTVVSADGTSKAGFVYVINLANLTVLTKIAVGVEPRGCALTPTGNVLYVANHTSNTVSIIDTITNTVGKTLTGFVRPYAVAITDNGNAVDTDEFIFVSDFQAALNPAAVVEGEPFDDGKRGIVRVFPFGFGAIVKPLFLSPLLDSGFTADRSAFCPNTIAAGSVLHSTIFCPKVTGTAGDPAIVSDPQGAFPNQLHTLLIRGNRVFVPSIGAAPEPPVKFNVNVQALVHEIDVATLKEIKAATVNLNKQIAAEPQPASPTTSLGRLFGNDIVAIDANLGGTKYYLVSRGGNYVIAATLNADKLDIGAPADVVRFQTGHIPTGIVVSGNGARAYTNNSVGRSVSVLDLAGNSVIVRDVESSHLPNIGSFEHNVLMGKLVFHTALGVPDNGLTKVAIRSVDPLKFRGKQSDNAWSSCASCHPAGLADGVTWMFAAGPRQTIPLDSTYSKRAGAHDTRILNWSAVRGSNTDFNANSIAVQGGTGFAGTPVNPNVFDHGITQGASEALDLETLWIQTIRPFNQPTQTLDAATRTVFIQNCAGCHGGAKWTKSQILYRDNPTLLAAGTTNASDPGLTVLPGGQIKSLAFNGKTLDYLEDIGTFSAANPLEIRGQGAASGTISAGGAGFNVPSLLDVRYHAPYFHDGSAPTLNDVFETHKLGAGTIATQLNATQRQNLLKLLNALDTTITPFRSEADDFRDPN